MLGFGRRTAEPAKRKTTLSEGFSLPEWAKSSDVLSRLTTISAERLKITQARDREAEALKSRRASIERSEAERVELLADAADITSPKAEEAKAAAAEILLMLDAERQAVQDGERVVATLQQRAEAFDEELVTLRLKYTKEVGDLLTGLFEHLAAEYSRQAPALAELILKMSAVQDLMIHYGSGNSNGFERSAYLPTVDCGNPIPGRPLIDCAAGLGRETEPHRKQIQDDLAAAGYLWRFQ